MVKAMHACKHIHTYTCIRVLHVAEVQFSAKDVEAAALPEQIIQSQPAVGGYRPTSPQFATSH